MIKLCPTLTSCTLPIPLLTHTPVANFAFMSYSSLPPFFIYNVFSYSSCTQHRTEATSHQHSNMV